MGTDLVGRLHGVLQVRDFRALWASMALSSYGDWLGLLAITATATSLVDSFSGQNYALGAVLLFRLLPSIVLGPLAGAFADRFDRRRTMVAVDLLRFVLFASIPLAGNLVWLFVAQFLIEAATLFWQPAKEAAVPGMLRRDQLEPANQLSLITTYGLTPVLAAASFALLSTAGDGGGGTGRLLDGRALALYVNALTFLVAALVIWRLPSISGRRAAGASAAGARPVEEESLLGSLRSGLSFAGRTPLVRGLVVGITGAFVAAGVVIATAQAFAASVGGGEAAYGLLFGAVFAGLGLGIALGPALARDLPRERTFGLALVGAGGGVLLLAWTSALWAALLLVVLVGSFAGTAYLAGVTLLGTEVDDELRGRTFALVQSLVRVALVVSLALVPFAVGLLGRHRVDLGAVVLDVPGERVVLGLAGVLAVVVGVVAARQMTGGRPAPPAADAPLQRPGAGRRLAGRGVLIEVRGAGTSTQVRRLHEWLTGEGLVVRAPDGPADGGEDGDDVLGPALAAGEVVLTGGVRTAAPRPAGGPLADLTVLLALPAAGGPAPRGRTDRHLVLDARRSADEVAAAVRVRVTALLSGRPLQPGPDRVRVPRARRGDRTGSARQLHR